MNQFHMLIKTFKLLLSLIKTEVITESDKFKFNGKNESTQLKYMLTD